MNENDSQAITDERSYVFREFYDDLMTLKANVEQQNLGNACAKLQILIFDYMSEGSLPNKFYNPLLKEVRQAQKSVVSIDGNSSITSIGIMDRILYMCDTYTHQNYTGKKSTN